MFECLRWGPTSLQTVKLNEYEVFTVCTMPKGRKHKIKIGILQTKSKSEQ